MLSGWLCTSSQGEEAFFLFAGFLPVLHLLSQHDFLNTNGLVLGFFAGSLLDFQVLSRNQFSSLARYARSGSRFFFLVLSCYLLIRLLEFVYPFSIEGIRQAFEISSEELNNLGIAFLAVFFPADVNNFHSGHSGF